MKPSKEDIDKMIDDHNKVTFLIELFYPVEHHVHRFNDQYFKITDISDEFKELFDKKRQVFYRWDTFYNGIIKVSSKVRKVTFGYKFFGENFPNDMFVCYTRNGKYYHENIKLQIPEFDFNKLI